jgi:hypothetical protein
MSITEPWTAMTRPQAGDFGVSALIRRTATLSFRSSGRFLAAALLDRNPGDAKGRFLLAIGIVRTSALLLLAPEFAPHQLQPALTQIKPHSQRL